MTEKRKLRKINGRYIPLGDQSHRNHQIYCAYLRGEKRTDIAKEYGISYGAAWHAIKKTEWKYRKKYLAAKGEHYQRQLNGFRPCCSIVSNSGSV